MRNVTFATPRKDALETALRDILRPAAAREELVVERYADPADQVQSSAARELAAVALEERAQRARDIRLALDKMAEGTYGACEQCEEPIGEKRLDAVPWARLCVACQSQAEGRAAFPVAA